MVSKGSYSSALQIGKHCQHFLFKSKGFSYTSLAGALRVASIDDQIICPRKKFKQDCSDWFQCEIKLQMEVLLIFKIHLHWNISYLNIFTEGKSGRDIIIK